MGKKVVIILLAVAGTIGFGIWKSAAVLKKAGALGTGEVDRFHTRYNEGKDAEIYAAASPRFREVVKQADLEALTGHMRRKLGSIKTAEREAIEVKSHNGDTQLLMTYKAAFEKGAGSMHYIYDYNEEAPLLMRFDVESDALREKK